MIILRRWIIALSLMLCFGIMSTSAFAAAAGVQAVFDANTGKVTVSGVLSSDPGKLVTIQVLNPKKQLDYLDQTTTGADGSYQFNYVLKKRVNGVYFVNVQVQDAAQAIGTTFEVKVTTDGGSDGGGSDEDSSGGGTSGPSAPGSPNNPTVPDPGTPVPGAGKPVVKLTPGVVMDHQSGKASAKLETGEVGAAAAGSAHLMVELQEVEGAGQYELSAPASLFQGRSDSKMALITKLGTLNFPLNLLSYVDLASAKEVAFSIARADMSKLSNDIKSGIGDRPVIELNVMVDGKVIAFKNSDAVVHASIPYQPTPEEVRDPEHIVIWYLDAAGAAQPVPSGKYDAAAGAVTFKTHHFSSFAVAHVRKSFGDLGAVEWARKPIEVMASKGIISGISDTSFNPEAPITRADFIILLTKTFGFTAEVQSNFRDVQPTDYYYEAVGAAKQLGLAEGQGDGLFNPASQISRQDMMVLISRALKKAGKWEAQGDAGVLDAFADKSEVASYAVIDLASLIKSGIIEGDGAKLHPTDQATRSEAAVMLYRIYNKAGEQSGQMF